MNRQSWPKRRAGARRVLSRLPDRAWSRSPPPLLLSFPPHCGCVRVFRLDPMRRAPRTIWRIPPLRHDALEPELAGVREHERAVRLVEVLVEAQARRGTREEARERGLFRLQTRPCLTIRKCDGHQLDRATTLSALAPYLPSPTSTNGAHSAG